MIDSLLGNINGHSLARMVKSRKESVVSFQAESEVRHKKLPKSRENSDLSYRKTGDHNVMMNGSSAETAAVLTQSIAGKCGHKNVVRTTLSASAVVCPATPRKSVLQDIEQFEKSCSIEQNSSLSQTIEKLLLSSSKLYPPRFRFDITSEAAAFNFSLLKENNFDLAKLLNAEDQPSITSYGSEFKPMAELEPLLGNHPRWDAFRTRLEEGAEFPIED